MTPRDRGFGIPALGGGARAAIFGFVSLVLIFLQVIPARGAEGGPAKRLRVVTTIFPIYCFASGVIGAEGEVHNLLPPNVGPHDYQLSPSDLRRIKDADIVIMNGLGLDNWVMKAFPERKRGSSASDVKHPILVLGSLLNTNDLILTRPDLDLEGKHNHGHEHEHSPANPHIWLNPQLAIECVNIISNAVSELNPAFKTNAASYTGRLAKLDSDLAAELAPIANKPFITQHDAFPYFVRRFQLKQVGIVEPTPDVPPSPRFLADLLKVIREKKVPVIFNDPRESSRLVKQIARDAKIRTAELDTLESGALDPNGYEKGMRRNAATMVLELK
jgi:zinc/manganese transport system substrate-binding protein